MPAAWQADAPFGVDIGGVNPQLLAFDASAAYDSGLTVGVTEGVGRTGLRSTPNLFQSWDPSTPISSTNGAVYIAEGQISQYAPTAESGEVILAQLTVANSAAANIEVGFNLQGQSADGEDWEALGVTFDTDPDSSAAPDTSSTPSRWAWRNTVCTAAGSSECNNMYSATAQLGTLGVPFSGFTLSGRDIVVGGQAGNWGGGDRMFFGSMAAVALCPPPFRF